MGITSNFNLETDTFLSIKTMKLFLLALLWPLYVPSQKVNHTMEDILEDTDMEAMVITLERDLPMQIATMEDILGVMDMAVMVITLERDPPKLKAITEDILEDTDTEVMDITLERDLPKASHTTEVMVDMVTVDTVDILSENRVHLSHIYLVI